MLLSARILENVSGVNAFSYATQASFVEGDTPTIYVQLVDLAQDRPEHGFQPSGRRYMPASGATLQVVLDHVDDARKVTRMAIQPFPQDPSIWSFPVMSTDKLRGTVNMRLTLTEGGRITRGQIQAALMVDGVDGMSRY